jgi:hypothetical protein
MFDGGLATCGQTVKVISVGGIVIDDAESTVLFCWKPTKHHNSQLHPREIRLSRMWEMGAVSLRADGDEPRCRSLSFGKCRFRRLESRKWWPLKADDDIKPSNNSINGM